MTSPEQRSDAFSLRPLERGLHVNISELGSRDQVISCKGPPQKQMDRGILGWCAWLPRKSFRNRPLVSPEELSLCCMNRVTGEAHTSIQNKLDAGGRWQRSLQLGPGGSVVGYLTGVKYVLSESPSSFQLSIDLGIGR